jgi:hypothetical protein
MKRDAMDELRFSVKMWRRILTVTFMLAWLLMVAATRNVAAKPPGLEVTIRPGPPYLAHVGQPLTVVVSVRNIGLTEHGVTAPTISNPDITATIEMPPLLVRVETVGRVNYASPTVVSDAQRTIIEWKAIPDREKIPEQKTVDVSLRLTLLALPPSGEFNFEVAAQSVDGYVDKKVFKFTAQALATVTPTRAATVRPTVTATASPTLTTLPTATATASPTATPTATSQPTTAPTATRLPTNTPAPVVALAATLAPAPTLAPTNARVEANDTTGLWVLGASVVVLLCGVYWFRRRA